jgi:formylglycine-generating enzyme required for sulfatase activity
VATACLRELAGRCLRDLNMVAKGKAAIVLILTAVLGLPLTAGAVHEVVGHWQFNPNITEPATVSVSPGSFAYRRSGEFRSGGAIVDAPLHRITFEQPLTIMKYQVSLGEYQRCVAEGVCDPALGSNSLDGNLPVTGVSFRRRFILCTLAVAAHRRAMALAKRRRVGFCCRKQICRRCARPC